MTTVHAIAGLVAILSGECGNPRFVDAAGVTGWSELASASVRAD